jgi:outer membrane usher protein FimD/PapC
VILTDASGAYLQPGSRAALGSGEAGVVGYDGRLWLSDPQAENEVVVSFDMKECRARFPYEAGSGRRIGPIVCE